MYDSAFSDELARYKNAAGDTVFDSRYVISLLPVCAQYSAAIAGISEEGFRVFPNPAQATVTLAAMPAAGDATILLSDVAGRMVARVRHDFGRQPLLSIPLGGLAPGIYFLKAVCADRQVFLRKVILQ